MIDRITKEMCTGCSACFNVCHKQAIMMRPDEEGFTYPYLIRDKCVQCGACFRVCPANTHNENNNYRDPVIYAGWNKDEVVRLLSTSGGIFSALAAVILKMGGYVVGAKYNKDCSISHSIISSVNDIPSLRQSKYAQSEVGNIYKRVKSLLHEGKIVLFCGTPCQSVALQSFLGMHYEKLYTCDFICRGVISPKVYQKFLNDMCGNTHCKVKMVHFKNKDYGWNRFSTKILFTDGNKYQKDRDHDYYMRGYLKHNLYLRPACHCCNYKSIPRQSDISLGDFWGIGNFNKLLDNDKGTSVIMINSDKGRQLLDLANDYLYLEERVLDEVVAGNSCLLNVTKPGKYRNFFFENMDRFSFDKLITLIDEKELHLSVKERVLRKLHLWKKRLIKLD